MPRHREPHRELRPRPWTGSLRQLARGRAGMVAGVLAFVALSGAAGQLTSGTVTGAVADSVLAASAGQADAASTTGGQGSGYFGPAPAAKDQAAKDQAAATGETSAATADASAADANAQAAEAARQAWLRDHPAPVAGLDQAQMDNALRIVQQGEAMGLPARAYVIAVATAMQESNLYNLANPKVAGSYDFWHEGSGSDHDSVGLFQQRANSGWGRVAELMNPHLSAAAFYRALVRVPGWQSLPLTRAAQRVQVSAYPNAYAKHEGQAQSVVDALVALTS